MAKDTHVLVTEDTHKKIKEIAEKEGRTLKAMTTRIVNEYDKNHKED